MKFSEILEIRNGKNQRNVENPNGNYPIYGSGGIMGWADDYICPANTVIIGRKGSINNPIYVETPFWNVDTAFGLVSNDKIILPKYLYYFCRSFDFEALNTTVTIPSLTKANLLQIEIDVPPLDEQRNIVEILDSIEKSIALYNKQIAKLDTLVKSRFIEMFGDPVTNPMGWEVKKLKDICVVGSSKRIYQSEQTSTGVPFLRISDLVSKITSQEENCDLHISEEKFSEFEQQGLVPQSGDILVTARGTLGLCYIMKPEDRFYFQDGMISWVHTSEAEINPVYISYLFDSQGIKRQIDSAVAGSTVAYLSIAQLGQFDILLPPIALQNQFAAFVAQADKSKSVLQKLLEKQELLRAALMQEYFGWK